MTLPGDDHSFENEYNLDLHNLDIVKLTVESFFFFFKAELDISSFMLLR